MIVPFSAKYTTFDLKKYKRIIFHDTEESCKSWRKTDLWFGTWHEELGKFSSEHLKMSKLVFSWDLFVQSRRCTGYNLRGFISNETEKSWKIWRGIDLQLQNWHMEFDEFWLKNLKVSKMWTLMGCFWPRYTMIELKRYRGDIFHFSCMIQNLKKSWLMVWKMTWGISQIFNRKVEVENAWATTYRGVISNKNWRGIAKSEEELTCFFKIGMRNLTDFDTSTQKSQHFAL